LTNYERSGQRPLLYSQDGEHTQAPYVVDSSWVFPWGNTQKLTDDFLQWKLQKYRS